MNTGAVGWDTAPLPGSGQVRLGVQLLDAEHRLVNRDHHREALSGPVHPGQTIEHEFTCPAPPTPGVHHLKIDLVAEGITWFEPGGSEVAVVRIVVT